MSNLQRQVIHGAADVGASRSTTRSTASTGLTPSLDVVVHPVRLSIANVDEVASGYDLVIDGTDNFPARYLVNDPCVRLGGPGLGVGLPVRRPGRGLLEAPTTGKWRSGRPAA